MNPMDFEEFLWAMGNDTLMDFIKECYKNKNQMGEALHRKAMDYFKEYFNCWRYASSNFRIQKVKRF